MIDSYLLEEQMRKEEKTQAVASGAIGKVKLIEWC